LGVFQGRLNIKKTLKKMHEKKHCPERRYQKGSQTSAIESMLNMHISDGVLKVMATTGDGYFQPEF
jgi:hypothetical protein